MIGDSTGVHGFWFFRVKKTGVRWLTLDHIYFTLKVDQYWYLIWTSSGGHETYYTYYVAFVTPFNYILVIEMITKTIIEINK